MEIKRISALILAAGIAVVASACAPADEDTITDTGDTSVVTDTAGTDDTEETPDYTYMSDGLTDNGFFEGFTASENVELPDYKGVARADVAAEVEKQIELTLPYHAEYIYDEITDRAVNDSDTLIIDYVGSVDGVEFEGGAATKAEVTIGVTNFIDGFLDQLVGHMPGENFDINVTFPEDYHNEELAGSPAVFNITIHYIKGELLETIIPEALTDEIAASYGYENVDGLVEYITSWVESSLPTLTFQNYMASVNIEELPEFMAANVNESIESDMSSIDSYASMYGMSTDEYAQMMGYTSYEAYREDCVNYYTNNAKMQTIVQAIAELEGITVTDEDIEAAGYTDYVEMYGRPYVAQVMLSESVIPNFVFENSVEAE